MEPTFGRYRLLERLGEGGMAEVWKAKSFGVEGFEKVLAIKRILPKLATHPRFVDMFVHEAKLAVRLSHANIVQVFDLGRVDRDGEAPSYFIAMEYVPGLDLATLLGGCRKLGRVVPFGMAAFVAAEVAKALDHAHRRRDEQARPLGIVHRDISPQNVLLSWEGEVKVTDFGIAKAKDTLADDESTDTRLGRIRGKLSYMSPEQARGEALDARSDLFALGAVLYEMLAGTNPFSAPTAFETLRRVQAAEHPPLALLRPETPRPLADIVARLLARDRAERIGDAGQLHEQLLGFFYASGERFGSNDVAASLSAFREGDAGDGGVSIAFEDEAGGGPVGRTPVEVPHGRGSPVRTGPIGPALSSDREGPCHGLRGAEMSERREVTALVLCFPGPRQHDADLSPPSSRSAPPLPGTPTPHERALDVLARYGAVVLEREPSQIVAIFGLGDADGRDTEAAVRASLVAVRTRSGSVSAGIHVARILVDPAGSAIQDERLASLVASAQALARATEGQVVVSPIAARIVRSAFSTEELPGSTRVIAESGRMVTSVRPPGAAYGRFVGRTDELRTLGQVLAHATRRRTQLVTLRGEEGIGKTRLLAEMERRLTKGSYNVGFYAASCPRNGKELPWSGLTAMLRTLCGIQEGDDEDRILDLFPRLRALGLHADDAEAVLRQLGASSHAAGAHGPGDTSAVLAAAFGRMVQSLCDDRLHCFAWDDAQGLDPATRDAVVAIANRSLAAGFGLRAVFLLVTREAPPEAFAAYPHHHRIDVTPLSDDDAAKLISARVGARMLPPELLSFCRERAGGHPLFLEELLKELTESGAVSVLSGAVQARLDGATAVPRTLRTLIAGRISRLAPGERAVLQAAAILGEPVLTPVLAEFLESGVPQVDRLVAALAQRDLARVTGPMVIGFASPMHGDIVLDAIPPEARRELHARAAAAYLSAAFDQGVEHAERIAEHLYHAGDRDRAASFFARAGAHKSRLRQLEPAIRLMTRALDLADRDRRTSAELVQWLGTLAEAAARVRSAPDLPDVCSRALRRIDAVGTLEERVHARVDVARALGGVHLFEAAYRVLEDAFQLAAEREDLRSRALVAEAEMAVKSGDFARAARAVDKIEVLGAAMTPQLLLVVAHARAATGNQTAALEALDRADHEGEGGDGEKGDPVAASERQKQRVLVHIYGKDFRAAVAASARAAELARSAGLRFETAAALHNLADASRRLGELPRAYAALVESKEIAESAGLERLVSLNRMHLAYLDGLKGTPEAVTSLEDLARYADARGYVNDAVEARCMLGSLHAHRGQHAQARRELEEVLRRATSYGNTLVAEDARASLASLPPPAAET